LASRLRVQPTGPTAPATHHGTTAGPRVSPQRARLPGRKRGAASGNSAPRAP